MYTYIIGNKLYIIYLTQDLPKEETQSTFNDNIQTSLEYEKYCKIPKFGELLFQEGNIKLYTICSLVCIISHVYINIKRIIINND